MLKRIILHKLSENTVRNRGYSPREHAAYWYCATAVDDDATESFLVPPQHCLADLLECLASVAPSQTSVQNLEHSLVHQLNELCDNVQEIEQKVVEIEKETANRQTHDRILEIGTIVIATSGAVAAMTGVLAYIEDRKKKIPRASHAKSKATEPSPKTAQSGVKQVLTAQKIGLSVRVELYKTEDYLQVLTPARRWHYRVKFKEGGYAEIHFRRRHFILNNDALLLSRLQDKIQTISLKISKGGEAVDEGYVYMSGRRDHHRRGSFRYKYEGSDPQGNAVVCDTGYIKLK